MIELRNWKWTSRIFFIQIAIAFFEYCLISERDSTSISGIVLVATVILTLYFGSTRQAECALCGLSAIFALMPTFTVMSSRAHVAKTDGWCVFLSLVAAGMSAASSLSKSNPWRDWLLNTLADLPLGFGFVIGGAILLTQKWQKRREDREAIA